MGARETIVAMDGSRVVDGGEDNDQVQGSMITVMKQQGTHTRPSETLSRNEAATLAETHEQMRMEIEHLRKLVRDSDREKAKRKERIRRKKKKKKKDEEQDMQTLVESAVHMPLPARTMEAHDNGDHALAAATFEERSLLMNMFERLHAKLAQALDIIWLCLGRENVRTTLSKAKVQETIEQFQSIRDASLSRRACFSVAGEGKEILENAVKEEEADLVKAMDVVRGCIERDEENARCGL